ncbi:MULTISPECIES: PilZ domain-containing protein [Bradyrhizobium]|uniref:PilZ domain-containing protein n=2 Tax=Bradyrhizobium symbiodeficiens TaxID=1404367 RepID=A0A6G9AF75_9BRAD|nr:MULTISPECIES: PilZ domain-containing protein [Bradyrhizobium]AWM08521.1 PilZ domain-containing protein [Bradyrhizobium symbiodeficiens]QDF39087.1 PilZ domain-containing protein [Bradyrhizobium symbiodeficiens]
MQVAPVLSLVQRNFYALFHDHHEGPKRMIEKRAAQRHRVFKGGTITFENSGIPCTVRNMSAGGVAIDLDTPVTLPQSITLSITRDDFVRNCRTIWRSDKRIGLAFVQ